MSWGWQHCCVKLGGFFLHCLLWREREISPPCQPALNYWTDKNVRFNYTEIQKKIRIAGNRLLSCLPSRMKKFWIHRNIRIFYASGITICMPKIPLNLPLVQYIIYITQTNREWPGSVDLSETLCSTWRKSILIYIALQENR